MDEGRVWLRELIAQLKEEYSVVDEGEAWCELTFAGEDGAPYGVVVERAHRFGGEWLVVWAHVGAVAEISPTEALSHNAVAALGALAVNEDECWLRHAMPVARLCDGDARLIVEALAGEARSLRAQLARRVQLSPVFESYAA